MQSRFPNPAANRSRTGRAPQPSSSEEPDSLTVKPRLDRGASAGTNMSYADTELFDCGTLLKLNMRALCSPERERSILLRACLVVLVGWVPLLLFTAYQSLVLRDAGIA